MFLRNKVILNLIVNMDETSIYVKSTPNNTYTKTGSMRVPARTS